MKKILSLFLFLFLSGAAFAQDTVTVAYALDTLSKDSFFLVETVSTPYSGSTRATELKTQYLFKDTSELNAYIANARAEYNAVSAQFDEIERRKAYLDYRFKRVKWLRDSVFRGSLVGGPRFAVKPPAAPAIIPDETARKEPPAKPKKPKKTPAVLPEKPKKPKKN